MINGTKIPRPTKAVMSEDIARMLGIVPPAVSPGSSVDSKVLDAIYEELTGSPSGAPDAYRKTEVLLTHLGLTYDPYWDTSESAEKGGSTVTARAFSRVRAALTDTPRCFILNVTDAPVGTRWETNHDEVYRFDKTVTGHVPLKDAGPGSRVIYYATNKSKLHKKHFIASATVAYVSPGWFPGPWEARLEDYFTFDAPVSVDDLTLPGWNRLHSITEISYETYQALVTAGGAAPDSVSPSATIAIIARPDSDETADEGGSDVAQRVIRDFPVEEIAVSIDVPDVLPAGTLASTQASLPHYTETDEGEVRATDPDALPPRSRNARRDKLAEVRAVCIATKALKEQGWTLERDCQVDGVGYDLRFLKAARRLKVEVKGIQGPRLAFNLTPKEMWRAETDPEWVLVAVTSVLSPASPKIHLLTRDQVTAAKRVISGYRVALG